MRKFYSICMAMLLASATQAQTYMRLWQGEDNTRMKIASMGDMLFNGNLVDIDGTSYTLSSIDSLVVVPEVNVVFNGGSASVSVPQAVQGDVTVTTNGGHVVITNTNVSNEFDINVSGTSTNGSLTYNGSYKCTFRLNGVELTNPSGAAIDIQCGKRVNLELVSGTQNTLVDGASGSQKAALYCRGHLEIEGGGMLTVSGNAGHAIASKEYLQLKKSTGSIIIAKAAKDAIHCGQHFLMSGGSISIDANTLGDGIQVEQDMQSDGVTPETDEENTGLLAIKGGSVEMTISQQDCKGMKSDKDIAISGGTIKIAAQGNGSRGMQCDGDLTISADDATTNVTISAEGGQCTLSEDIDDPHRCCAIKTDGGVTINSGTVTLTATGKKARAIRALSYTVNGGTVSVPADKIKVGD